VKKLCPFDEILMKKSIPEIGAKVAKIRKGPN